MGGPGPKPGGPPPMAGGGIPMDKQNMTSHSRHIQRQQLKDKQRAAMAQKRAQNTQDVKAGEDFDIGDFFGGVGEEMQRIMAEEKARAYERRMERRERHHDTSRVLGGGLAGIAGTFLATDMMRRKMDMDWNMRMFDRAALREYRNGEQGKEAEAEAQPTTAYGEAFSAMNDAFNDFAQGYEAPDMQAGSPPSGNDRELPVIKQSQPQADDMEYGG